MVDLVTGVPLLQEIDFELSFGGATFRHVRTYSTAISPLPTAEDIGYDPWAEGPGAFWDWNGRNWCISENPILLIDAAYAYAAPGEPNDVLTSLFEPGTRTCYFIPDAHHSVPLIRHPGSESYSAPPWFDVIMSHNGGGGFNQLGEWTTPPTEFYVWTHRKSIKYTFTAYYEDIWDDDGVNLHTSPPASYGIPYYALVTRIEDRYGNRMEYEYCDFVQEAGDNTETQCCVECKQNCHEKGQIRWIKLITGDNRVVYTLVYTHRDFKVDGRANAGANFLDPRRNQNALHTIHVYEGDATWLPVGGCFTLSHSLFCSATSLDAIDNINSSLINAHPDWILEARYLYSESRNYGCPGGESNLPSQFCPGGDLTGSSAAFGCPQVVVDPASGQETALYAMRNGGHLLKSCITRRTDVSGSAPLDKYYNIYRRDTQFDQDIVYCYGNETIRALISAEQQQSGDLSIGPNFLLALSQDLDMNVWVNDSITGEMKSKHLHEVADLAWTDSFNNMPLTHDHFGVPNRQSVRGFLGLTDQSLILNANVYSLSPVALMSERRKGYESGDYAYFHFVTYPDNVNLGPFSGSEVSATQLTFHFPYPFIDLLSGFVYLQPQIDKAFFTTVIDEISDPAIYDSDSLSGIRSRRAVSVNVAGAVLSDRTWHFRENGEAEIVEELGRADSYVVDCKGRTIEKRSHGWSAADNPDSDGLIHVFEYEDACCNRVSNGDSCLCTSLACMTSSEPPGELVAEGIKKGRNGQLQYLRRFERHVARKELIAREIRYPTPNLAGASGEPEDVEVVRYLYELDPSHSVPDDKKRILEKTTIRSETPAGPGLTGLYAVTKSRFDENGNTIWQGEGTCQNSTGTGLVEFFTTKLEYDLYGALLRKTEDYGGEGTEAPPTGFERHALAQPLNYVTRYLHNPLWGVTRTTFPNGRQTKVQYLWDPDGYIQWTFSNLIEQTDPPGVFKVLSPVQIRFLKGGRIAWEKTVRLLATDFAPDGQGVEAQPENQELISSSTPTYAPNGRFLGMQQSGADGSSLAAEIAYDGFGNIARQEDPDGTITRHIYDELGRIRSTYRGSNDSHEFWGTGVPCDQDGEPVGCFPDGEYPDNLTLIEKRYYGNGVTDADQLVEVRRYRDQPDNQYFEEAPLNEPQPPPNNEDSIGWIVQYKYDWRMRPIHELRKDQSGADISHTLTWVDNLSRQRFVAQYGEVAPTGWPNPTALDANSALPNAATILGASPVPLSLEEYLYDARGQIKETRRYDTTSAAAPQYTATLNYYNHRNQPVEVLAPNSPVMRYVYDAKGRRVQSSTMVGEVEVARTETIYDRDDRAVLAVQSELSGQSAGSYVRTFVYNWYDIAGRVIASANFGTSDSQNRFVSVDDEPIEVDPESPQPIGPPPVTISEPTGLVSSCRHDDPRVATALLTCYRYNGEGRQERVFHPDQTITSTEYDDLGRVLLTREYLPSGSANAPREVTAYKYDAKGRLEKMAGIVRKPPPNPTSGSWPPNYAAIDWSVTDGSIQVTQFLYDATVVDSAGTSISENNAFVSEVRFPDKFTGQPSTTDIIRFTYHADGAVATRTDAKGIVFAHQYDELGRRQRTDIDDSAWNGVHPSPPPNRIRRVDYDYDTLGNLIQVDAYRIVPPGSSTTLLSQNSFQYDQWNNLTQEGQAHVNAANMFFVDYDWEFSPMGTGFNYNRLVGITYPERIEDQTRLALTLGYGSSPTSADSILNRISGISIPGATLAGYAYVGTSRRIQTTLGCGVNQTVADAGELTGLDRFGRLTDLHYRLGAQTIHRYEYGYDLMGNRIHARVTQHAHSGHAHNNDRSSLYEYDALHRLKKWTMGQLSSDNSAIDDHGQGVAPYPRSIEWKLDDLGNWSGGDIATGSEIRTQNFFGGEEPETVPFHHAVNQGNQVTERYTNNFDNGNPIPNPSYIYDPNGNLAYDEQYVYQYDAWNRLIQVNEAGMFPAGADGRITDTNQLGALVCRYSYDGLGRLIRKETPVSEGVTALQIKDIYYDGVRRIQETITRPPVIQQGPFAASSPQADPTGGAGTFQAQGPVANDEQPLEKVVEAGEPEPIQQIIEPQMLIGGGALQERWTDREYVYGPDYVDEFICQIDRYGRVFYMLQDANYNVVAIVSGGGQGIPSAGTVLSQYTYEPYGLLVAAEYLSLAAPVNRVGHQGLFFERFDGQYTDLTIAATNEGLYYNRNRFYSPVLGRFIQRDPNETGLPILAALAMNGEAASILMGGFSPSGLFSDGMNLYEYVGGNPVNSRDPLGLYDDFDEAISDATGQKLYAIGMLNEGARVASIGLNLALDIALSMLPGAGIYDAFNSIEVIMSGGGGFWDVMNIVSMAVPGAKLLGSLDSLRALSKAGKFRRMHCNCFVEGTPVETAEGPRPIESIQEGDIVLTRDQGDPCQPPKAGRVTGIFRSIAPAILWLSFSSGQVIGTTIGHEVWTDQDGWTSAGLLEVGDTLLDQNGNAIAVSDIRLDPTPAIVYNLEVQGAHTFFVDGVWVHNNSCRVIRGAFDLFSVRKVPDSDLVRQPNVRGNAPVGRDGRAIEIHHVDQSPDGPFEEITWTGHRAIPTKRPGLSPEERRWFEAARRRYWEMQWDAGRFNHLSR